VLTTTEASKTLTRAYDTLGRLTSYTDGNGNVFGYQYDSDGRMTQLTYPGGRTVTYAYDADGKLYSVTDWAGRVTSYVYDNDCRVTKVLRADGSAQTYTFDAAGQLTQLTDLKADQSTVIHSASLGLDLAGQVTSETLVPALTPTVPNATQTVDSDNRLMTYNGSAVTFDPNGNLLTIANGVTPASYTYDARNRLTSAGGIGYGYDSDNRRVALTDSTGTTSFAINPNATLDQVLVKTAPNGTQTFYVYGLGLEYEDTGGVATYYHYDQLGNTVALTNGAGAITGQVSYGTYGEIVSETGTVATPFLFNGRWGVQTDSNGLYYHRARYYHPQLRRFLNQDTVLGSITTPASLNRFAYANGEPISGIDPFGTMYMNVDPNSGSIWSTISSWIRKNVSAKISVDFNFPVPNVFGPTAPGNPGQYTSWVPIGIHADAQLGFSGASADVNIGLGTPQFLNFGQALEDVGFGAAAGANVLLYGSNSSTSAWDVSASGGDGYGGELDLGLNNNFSLQKIDVTVGTGFGFGATATRNVGEKSWSWSSSTPAPASLPPPGGG
jgi:RHS repeat-associated protein